MSGSDTQYLTETDPEDGSEPPLLPQPTSLPDGIAPARNAPAGPQLRDNRAPPVEQPFEIIDTDDNLVPLAGRGNQPTEPRLTDTDAGPRSLVDRQAAEQAEQQRQRRARTPAERRAAAREGRDRTLSELASLRRQNEELVAWKEQVEPQLAGIGPRLQEIDQGRVADQIAGFDRGIQEQQARATDARRRISEAMVSQDGEALTAALEQRDSAIMEQQRLTVQRNMLATGDPLGRTDQGQRRPADQRAQPREQTQQPQPQRPPPLPPRAQALADDFAGRHAWLGTRDPNDDRWAFERDTALRLDAEVAREGYNPSDLEYWDVLEDRMRQYLPHRFDGEEPQAAPGGNGNRNNRRPPVQVAAGAGRPVPERRGPMVPGGGDRPTAPGGNQVYLSPARKLALQEAGIIGRDGQTVEDQTRFRRVLKQYQDYDRANGTVRQ